MNENGSLFDNTNKIKKNGNPEENGNHQEFESPDITSIESSETDEIMPIEPLQPKPANQYLPPPRKKSNNDLHNVLEGEHSNIIYILLAIFLPIIIGVLFLFFYACGASFSTFEYLDLDLALTWVIGYEMIVVLILVFIGNKTWKTLFRKK